MSTVIRGPNLPPRVVGGLIGYFKIHIERCHLDEGKTLDTYRLVFWGLKQKEMLQFGNPMIGESYTVVCPVVTEWQLFEEYLRQSKTFVLEIFKRGVLWNAVIEPKYPVPESESNATRMAVGIFDSLKNYRGRVVVCLWIEKLNPKMALEGNKRRRTNANLPTEIVIQSVADIFDVLDVSMTKGMRLIDIYRFCNKLNTPVADLTSLVDRFVDPGTSVVFRKQFWDLMDPKGTRIFTFAEFSRRFKNAKKGVTLIRNEIKIEVPVIERLKNLFHDLVHLQKQKLYIDMDSNALVEALKKCQPEMTPLDTCCVLVSLFFKLPDRTSWTLEDIRIAFDLKTEATDGSSNLPEIPSSESPPRREPHPDPNDHPSEGPQEQNEKHVQTTSSTHSLLTKPTLSIEEKPEGSNGTKAISESSSTDSSLQRADTLTVLKNMIDKILPQSIHQPCKFSKETKENVTTLLDDLIVKCQGLIGNMSKSACSIAATSDASNLPSLKRPIPLNGDLTPGWIQSGERMESGLPDDPEMIIQDALFHSRFLKRENVFVTTSVPERIATMSSIPKLTSEAYIENESVKVQNRSVASTMGQQTKQKPVSLWVRFVLHQVSLLDKNPSWTATVKTRGFSKEIGFNPSPLEKPVWIPVKQDKRLLHVVIEVHPVLHSEHQEFVLGIAALNVELEEENVDRCIVNRRSVHIKNPFDSKEKGIAEISLSLHSQRPSRCPETTSHQSRLYPSKQNEDFTTVQNQLSNEVQIHSRPMESKDVSVQTHAHDMECNPFNPVFFENQKPTEESFRLQMCVRRIQFDGVHSSCYICCCLEKEPNTVFKSTTFTTSSTDINFHHAFEMDDASRDWLDQALVFKVVSVTERSRIEEIVGELQLDLSCLSEWGRICGPLGVLDGQLKQIGIIELDVQLLRKEGNSIAFEDDPDPYMDFLDGAQTFVPERAPTNTFLTCSDDENYVVIGGFPTPDYDEIDEICDVFLPSNKPSGQTSCSGIVDPFHCDDASLLKITRNNDPASDRDSKGKDTSERSFAINMNAVEDAKADLDCFDGSDLSNDEEMYYQRHSSDAFKDQSDSFECRIQTSTNQRTEVDSLPVLKTEFRDLRLDNDATERGSPPLRFSSVEPNESTRSERDSISIDDLLKKYSIERKPGWWKSLVSDDVTMDEEL